MGENPLTQEDPGFTDAAAGVFRLKFPSPLAERIGFLPIPFEEIELYRDGYRAELPVQAVAEARAMESPSR